jgi:hypothetical protein
MRSRPFKLTRSVLPFRASARSSKVLLDRFTVLLDARPAAVPEMPFIDAGFEVPPALDAPAKGRRVNAASEFGAGIRGLPDVPGGLRSRVYALAERERRLFTWAESEVGHLFYLHRLPTAEAHFRARESLEQLGHVLFLLGCNVLATDFDF